MSSATTTSYEESIGSCRPPTPPTPPAPPPPAAGHRGAPMRRQLDFGGGGDLDNDDDDGLLCRALDDIERGYSEAKRRAPPCVCRRGGVCAVERDEQRNRWMYVCPSRPKCKHVALYEEVDLNPKSKPALSIHPKASNPCVLNGSNNHMVYARAAINDSPRGAGATTQVYVSPQGARATTPINVGPRSAGATTPVYVSPQGAHATTPVNVGPRGAGATSPNNASPQGARSNEPPICLCTAGKCTKSIEKGKQYYVCPIRKGQGACSHKVLVSAAAKEPPQTGNNNTRGDKHFKYNPVEKVADGNNLVQLGDKNANGSVNPSQPGDDEWPFVIVDNDIVPTAQPAPCDEVRQESPSMLHQSIAVVKTPEKSPMPPNGTRCPFTPGSDICFRCHEKGHWSRDCPKSTPRNSPCYQCGVVGHWKADCPLLRDRREL